MPRIACIVLLTMLFASCSQPEQKLVVHEPETETGKSEVKQIGQEAMVLTPGDEADKRPVLDSHLFGKFFGDRAEFFVIQNSASKIHDSQVKTIILYYLDDQHCQSKFILSDNIADELIARYGKFSISPLDMENRQLLESEPILLRENEKNTLNKVFTRFELSWKLPDKTIRFRVEKNNAEEQYVYTEHIPDYENVFRAVEKSTL
jgi:hypothetical protein